MSKYTVALVSAVTELTFNETSEALLTRIRKRLYRKFISLNLAKYFPYESFNQTRLATIIIEAKTNRPSDQRSRSTLHKAAVPFDRVIAILENREDWDRMTLTLATKGTGPKDLMEGAKRLDSLRRDLRVLRDAVPSPPPKYGKGKPSKTKCLHAFVRDLAEFWIDETGHRFTQGWAKGKGGQMEPITLATRFVYDVVSFVYPSQLGALRKVTEKIVSERPKSGK